MTNGPARAEPPCLIVNADDYGYFRGVSRGILEAAERGVVTATGVFANRDDFEERAGWLRERQGLDVGVHLNLTSGTPLTAPMRNNLSRSSGSFAGKYAMTLAVLTGRIPVREVADEWQAQIERCLAAGLQPRFLNSHEHIHMLPALFDVVATLAGRYGIAHIRFPTAERPARLSAGALVRNAIMKGLEMAARPHVRAPVAHFLGLEASGRLDGSYFRRAIATLRPGRIYELMCHPGHLDRDEVHDARLLRYHDWEGEFAALTSPDVRALLESKGVRLIGYRHLKVESGRLRPL